MTLSAGTDPARRDLTCTDPRGHNHRCTGAAIVAVDAGVVGRAADESGTERRATDHREILDDPLYRPGVTVILSGQRDALHLRVEADGHGGLSLPAVLQVARDLA